MSRTPYSLSLRYGSGPSAVVLADFDFLVDTEVDRPSRRDDFEVRIVALAVDGMRKNADGRWHAAATGNLLLTRDPVLGPLIAWAQDAILADEAFVAARIEEALEAASEAREDAE